MVNWSTLAEAIDAFLVEATPGEEAKRRGLKHVAFGQYADPHTGEIVAKSEKGRLVLVKKAAEKQRGKPDKQKKRAPERPSTRPAPARAGHVTPGGDAAVKNQLLQHGWKAGTPWTAPGNPGGAFNEVLTGEAMQLVIRNPKLVNDPKALASALKQQHGKTALFQQNATNLDQKLFATAKSGIAEAHRVNEALTRLNQVDPRGKWTQAKINHYYGAQASIEAMAQAIQTTASHGRKIVAPSGEEIAPEVALKLVRGSGGGANPSDTAVFAESPNGDLAVMFTSNKLNVADQQANSTLKAEFETARDIVGQLAKSYSPKQLEAAQQSLEQLAAKVAKEGAALKGNIGQEIARAVLKSRALLGGFLRNVPRLDPNDKRRWAAFKKKVGVTNDAQAAKAFFKQFAEGKTPTNDEAKVLARAMKAVKGAPTAESISAKSRGRIITAISKNRKQLNQLKSKDGIGLGNAIEAANLIEKLHLGVAFNDITGGINDYEGIFEVNMGGVRLTPDTLRKCLSASNSKDFTRRFAVSDPIPVKDKEGNVTGARAELFSLDEKGRKHLIAKREVRSKQGITGKLETSYKWQGEMQRCFKSGGQA